MKIEINNSITLLTVCIAICSSYTVIKYFKARKKVSKGKDFSKIGLLPENAVDIGEDDYNSDDDIDPPFAPKKSYHWWFFITRHFQEKKPPIDKTMLALHKSAMAYIHKIPLDKIPKGHVPVDKGSI